MLKKYVVQRPFEIQGLKYKPGEVIENPDDYLVEGKFVEVLNANETLLIDNSSTVTLT